jgi:hypothetical protein
VRLLWGFDFNPNLFIMFIIFNPSISHHVLSKRKSLEITSSSISYRKLSIAVRKSLSKGFYIGVDLKLKVTRASFTVKMD